MAMNQSRLNRIENKQDEHGLLLNDIKSLLIGIDGKNGIRGEVKMLRADVDGLKAIRYRNEGMAWIIAKAFGAGSVVVSGLWALFTYWKHA